MDAHQRVDLASLQIPSLPSVVQRLQALMADPGSGLAEIGGVISTDPPLAARVLRTANSAAYGLREPVHTLQRAATVLGVRVLRDVVLQTCLAKAFEHLADDERLDLERMWRHSLAAAIAARELALRGESRLIEPHDAYTCGLLHDLGKLVLFQCMREPYAQVLRDAARAGSGTHEIELERLGASHAQVGGLLAQAWELPAEISSPIRLHHAPPRELLLAPMAGLVALADALVLAVERGEGHEQLLEHPACRLSKIGADGLEQVAERVVELWPALAI